MRFLGTAREAEVPPGAPRAKVQVVGCEILGPGPLPNHETSLT